MRRVGLVTKLWSIIGVFPLAMWLADELRTIQLLALLMYAAGWAVIIITHQRRHDESILIGALGNRAGWIASGTITAFSMISIFLTTPGEGVLCALLAFLLILLSWITSSTKERMTKSLGLMNVSFFSVLFALLFCEALLGIQAKQRPANDFPYMSWGHKPHLNEWGFRERNVPETKDPSEFRIMVLGDSLTWGIGLPEKERYSNILEQKLQLRFPDKTIRIYNFGISGYATIDQSDCLRRLGKRVQPDLVIIGFCLNDTQTKEQHFSDEYYRYSKLYHLINNLGRMGYARIANMLTLRTNQLLVDAGKAPDWTEALDRTYATDSPEWMAFEHALDQIQVDAVHLTGQTPIFAPLLYENGDFNAPNDTLTYVLKWNKQAGASAQRHNFDVTEMETEFKAEGERVRWVNEWDAHPDATCNAIYAKMLEPLIESRIKATPPE